MKRYITDKQNRRYEIVRDDYDWGFRIWVHRYRAFDHTVVGWLWCRYLDTDHWQLSDIVLHDPARCRPRGLAKYLPFYSRAFCPRNYRRRGLGTKLLRAFIGLARMMEVKVITGEVKNQGLIDNPKLLEWYQRHGFKVMMEPDPGCKPTDTLATIRLGLE